jgi:hypothetical protein
MYRNAVIRYESRQYFDTEDAALAALDLCRKRDNLDGYVNIDRSYGDKWSSRLVGSRISYNLHYIIGKKG